VIEHTSLAAFDSRAKDKQQIEEKFFTKMQLLRLTVIDLFSSSEMRFTHANALAGEMHLHRD
jgi:hypothetical protein